MKEILSGNQFLILFVTLFSLTIAGNTSALTVTGEFSGEHGSPLSADIHFSLQEESIVSLKYIDGCADPDNAKIELYTSWDAREGYAYLKDISQPWYPLPLAAGYWTVRISCWKEKVDQNNPVAYTLEYSYVAGSSQFPKDSEPDAAPEEAITLTGNQSFSGWIGYMGYKSLYDADSAYYPLGIDGGDKYYFRLTKGTKIKIRLDYDQTLIGAMRTRDISVSLGIWRDGQTYLYNPLDLSNWWQFSGDTTEEFIIPQDDIYYFRVVGAYPDTNDKTHFPKNDYGGYRMSIIVNGEPEPEPEPEGLFLTFRQATWVKKTPAEGKPYYNLVVKCQVENTYNESKTFKLKTEIDAAVLRLEGGALPRDKEDTIAWIKKEHTGCEFGKINWDQFCEKQGDLCIISQWEKTSTYSDTPIPSHSKQNYTLSLEVTLAAYKDFDQGVQLVRLGILDIEDPEIIHDCYVHGLYYMPGWGFLPGVNHLLRRSLIERKSVQK